MTKSKNKNGHCVKWGCNKVALVFLRRDQSHQTNNGFFVIKIDGDYCPNCGGSYGNPRK